MTQQRTTLTRASRLAELVGLAGLLSAVVLGLVLLGLIVWNRAFQVDEIEHIHAAFNMRSGRVLYRDFGQVHNPLLYALLAPLVTITDPVSTFHRARILSALILVATIAMSALCAGRLGGRLAAGATATLSLFHTTLIERGMEVRPDCGMVLSALVAMYIELAEGRGVRRRALAGLALGVGFLFTQKSVFVTAAFGAWWLWDAVKSRDAKLVVVPVAAWFVPLLLAMTSMVPFGCLREYVRQDLVEAFFAGAGARYSGRFSPASAIVDESLRNLATVVFGLAGLVLAFQGARHRQRRDLALLCLVGVTSIAALWGNPFPWPYVHVGTLPFVIIAAGYAVSTLAERTRAPLAVTCLAVICAMVTAVPRLLSKAPQSTDLQFATMREMDRVTAPNETVFDLVGLYFRRDAYPAAYAMSTGMLGAYQAGSFERMVPALRRNQCAALITNYRVSTLGFDELEFLRTHYVHHWGNIYLAGRDLTRFPPGSVIPFEVLAPAKFIYQGAGEVMIDGVAFTEGELAAGLHDVTVVRAGPSRLIRAVTPPALAPLSPQKLYVNFD